MAIATLDQWIGSAKQIIPMFKDTARTSVAFGSYSMFDVGGSPGAGTLAGSSTTAGVVPTDATAGFPAITFSSGTGYLSSVAYNSTASGWLTLVDVLWKGGAYAYNSGTTSLSSQPSYSSRVPGGDYRGTDIWIEVSTAFSSAATWHVECTYTDQSANAGATTGTMSSKAATDLTLGRMHKLSLASGDSGVQKIESVVVTTGSASAGAFNVLVVRQLWRGRVAIGPIGSVHGFDMTGLPVLFSDSALSLIVQPDSTSTGTPDVMLCIASA